MEFVVPLNAVILLSLNVADDSPSKIKERHQSVLKLLIPSWSVYRCFGCHWIDAHGHDPCALCVFQIPIVSKVEQPCDFTLFPPFDVVCLRDLGGEFVLLAFLGSR